MCLGSSLALLLARCGTVSKSLDLFALQFVLWGGEVWGCYLRVVGKQWVLSTHTENSVGHVLCAALGWLFGIRCALFWPYTM